MKMTWMEDGASHTATANVEITEIPHSETICVVFESPFGQRCMLHMSPEEARELSDQIHAHTV